MESDFLALRIATELLFSLSYKLKMFGINIEDYSDTFFDNLSMMENVTLPQSVPNNKNNSYPRAIHITLLLSVVLLVVLVQHGGSYLKCPYTFI